MRGGDTGVGRAGFKPRVNCLTLKRMQRQSTGKGEKAIHQLGGEKDRNYSLHHESFMDQFAGKMTRKRGEGAPFW